ncbi:MAG TPA: hypothetical protein VJL09_00555, partial [Candidatus Paceibacterota bacterium]
REVLMKIRKSFFWLSGVLGVLAGFGSVLADEADEYDRWKENYGDNIKVKTYKGINFKLPEDYPIKQYEGYVAPIPFEDYAYMKFDKVHQRLEVLEKKVAELEEKLKPKEKEKQPAPPVASAEKTA